MNVVECVDVRFSYGKREALAAFTASFAPGMTGLLGPNGAGKSTLFLILTTLAKPRSGRVTVAGHDVQAEADQVRRAIGFLPQRFDVLAGQSVRRNIEYAAWARGLTPEESEHAAEAAIERLGLSSYADAKARSLSGGYRQRLGIACATAHDPAVLLLDEPTVGIDPIARTDLRRTLAEVAQTKTVILATHLVEDVALAAGKVVIVDGGRCLFSGSTAALAELGERGEGENQSPLEAGYEAVLRGPR